ncbi:hypothetical protein T265_10162 [Opisthorchis viverrini]|uniref:Uncharacterized protein n=1 Tax=Opisthorchis viverrini TaxID=6198 RepID=A0A075A2B5_OPIVI|nr:hypothetical protein T265_10162 [Opisthorchis viverrini]KER21539.1 hypothetical protein T265_10162 [Opisthorchis viverrini]
MAVVVPFRCPAAMPLKGSARAGILPGCPSLDRESRAPKIGFETRTFRSLIKLEDGTLKLFAERGRVLETQISYRMATKRTSEQSDRRPLCQDIKLRFLPFNRCGSVVTPVLGFRGPMQKKAYNMPDQLCFIQLLADNAQDSPNYATDSGGFHYMEIRMLDYCDIYQLVFPFLNSQCPTAYRKDVWIRVSVINDKKLILCKSLLHSDVKP